MYKMSREPGVSLVAIATIVLLLAPSAMAGDGDIVGMDFRANYDGGLVGKVQDVRGGDVIVALNDGSQVTVPMSDVIVRKDQGHVMFKGSKGELYSMADDTRRGYYRDRYRDDRYRDDRYRDDRYRDDRYRDDRDRGYYGDRRDDRYDDPPRDRYDNRDRPEGFLDQLFGK